MGELRHKICKTCPNTFITDDGGEENCPRCQVKKLKEEVVRAQQAEYDAKAAAEEAETARKGAFGYASDMEARAKGVEGDLAAMTAERDAQRKRVLLCTFGYDPSPSRCAVCSEMPDRCGGRRMEKLWAALRQWKCDECGGSGEYGERPDRTATVCPECEGVGRHPIARAALGGWKVG